MSSPLLASVYDPSNTLLATAIVELDSHKVRVQSISPTTQSSLNIAFKLPSNLSTMAWGILPSGSNNSNNNSIIKSVENEFLAIGLVSGSIQIFSPMSNQIIVTLITPTNSAITDIHYSTFTNSLWTSDISGNVYEWDLASFQISTSINICDFLVENSSNEQIAKVSTTSANHLLIATHSVYLYDISAKKLLKTFPAHIQPVNTLIPIPSLPDLFLTSATNDRFINLYSISKVSAVLIFVTQSPVLSVSIGHETEKEVSVLSAITEDGKVEIFNNPFAINGMTLASPSRKKRRQIQSRSCDANIVLARPKTAVVANDLFIASINTFSTTLVVSWLENVSVPYFDTLSWLSEAGEFTLANGETRTLVKAKPDVSAVSNSTKNGHDIAASKHYNEGNAIVTDGSNFKDVNNESDSDDDNEHDNEDDGETLAEKLDKLNTSTKQLTSANGSAKKVSKRKLGGATLTIILSQALKNNDHSLLETVLANRDPNVIQNTISKLDSLLAVSLLDRLAERIARQTSRFDQLNIWLKWIIIIHGGVLTSLPNLSSKLSNLHAILLKKADSLPRLLELQGRLNLLYQQIELKREIIEEDEFANGEAGDESDVEYIEELDDAEFNGDISGDEFDMDGEDDFEEEEEDDEDEEEDDENENVADVLNLETPEDEEAYSDVEIEVHNDLMEDDEEEEEQRAADLKVKNHIKMLKSQKKKQQK